MPGKSKPTRLYPRAIASTSPYPARICSIKSLSQPAVGRLFFTIKQPLFCKCLDDPSFQTGGRYGPARTGDSEKSRYTNAFPSFSSFSPTDAVDDGDQFLTALGPGSNENEQALLLVALVFQPNPFGPSLAAIDE